VAHDSHPACVLVEQNDAASVVLPFGIRHLDVPSLMPPTCTDVTVTLSPAHVSDVPVAARYAASSSEALSMLAICACASVKSHTKLLAWHTVSHDCASLAARRKPASS
jgi:hypothetical protein